MPAPAPAPLRPLLLRLRRTYSTAPALVTATTLPAAHTGTIKLLHLNRPAAKNAISRALLSELGAHLAPIAAGTDTDTRLLILASAVPAVFCAGADLKERATFTPADTTHFLTTLRSTLTTLSTLPIPTISAIDGLALGGGLELALATDLRVVGAAAQLALPETRLAIIPGAGGTWRLRALVGRSRALDMVLTGRRVAPAEALAWGLVDRVVGGGGAVEGAVAVAGEVCRGGPVAVRAAVEAVRGAGGSGEEREGRAYGRVVGTRDRDEALRAFREKRAAVFRGE